MKPDTWMPIYLGDYLRDTMHLTTEQHGAYFLLLMAYWAHGPLPNNDRKLAAISKCSTKAWRGRVGPTVREFFQVEADVWRHVRADEERANAAHNSEVRREASHAMWSQKRRKTANLAVKDQDRPPNGRKQLHAVCTGFAVPELEQNAAPSPSPIKEDSDPTDPAQAAPVPGMTHDARSLLWREGVPIVRALTGRGDRGARTVLAWWLSQLRDDCAGMLRILQDASSMRPLDPVGWIEAAVQDRKPAPGRGSNLDWMYEELGLGKKRQ